MVAPALIAAGASVLGGLTGGKGAKKAAQIQAQAYQHGIDVQNQQFQQTRQDNMPFLQAGYGALDQTKGLLGLNGADQQQALYDMIKSSPGFQALFNTGTDAVLQNAAATGGVRGGNVNNELARFGSGLFAQQIQQQLGNLAGLISAGSGTALNLGSLGQQNANSVADLIGKQGGANAVSAVSPYAAFQGILNQIGGDARTAMAEKSGWLSGIGNDPLGIGSIFGGVNAGKNMPGGGVINNIGPW